VPELPEVETVRAGLGRAVIGKAVTEVAVLGRRTVRRQSPEEFTGALRGRALVGAGRRGKYLLVALDDGAVLVGHLRMSGQLRYFAPPLPEHERHTHAVIGFEDESELRFIDPRTFGELFVTRDLDKRGVPSVLSGIGVDPLVDGVGARVLETLLAGRRRPLKAFLLDQSGICGIGSVYADEICFAARLSPERRTDTLTRRDIGRLAAAIAAVLGDAVEHGGSSLADERYRGLLGDLGSYQSLHAVYGRTGSPCLRCRRPVVRSSVGGRSAHFCPHCQK